MAHELKEDKYLVYTPDRALSYVLQKRFVEYKPNEEDRVLIRDPTTVERTHMKITEEKYKNLLMSTITHDLKTPLAEIQGQLSALSEFVQSSDGLKHLTAAKVSVTTFRYYLYCLIVPFVL
ncbi:MAG: hypothetical protein P4M11_10090 [Candidatus Pacebacteria bacterium]|nr:hypothetical protein [Candidatus Paceibacterota bacterium]